MKTQLPIFILVLLCLAGCDEQPSIEVRLLPRPKAAADNPPFQLPQSLRQRNWVSKTNGEGSCVIASTVSLVRWQQQFELAEYLRNKYSGGQTASSIQSYLTQARVPFVCTETADPRFLEWATQCRRGAIIWFFPFHCVTFAGFGTDSTGRPVAWILDNNRPERFIPVEKSEFLRRWAGYGGFALTTLYEPAPPTPWRALEILE